MRCQDTVTIYPPPIKTLDALRLRCNSTMSQPQPQLWPAAVGAFALDGILIGYDNNTETRFAISGVRRF
jgi:hypothetical protein